MPMPMPLCFLLSPSPMIFNVTELSETDAIAATRASGRMLAAMSIPQFPRLWATGMLLNLTRWMAIFLCSYLVNDLTHSTVLVQLVGASLFAPMFLGGVLAGAIADRLD